MNRSRRVSMGLLTLAVTSLGVDKLFLSSEPSGASAASIVATPTLESRTTKQEESLADVLGTLLGEGSAGALAGDAILRSAFAAPRAWRPAPAVKEVAPEAPLPALHLSSTSTQAAVINGVAVRVGALLDDAGLIRLVSVDGERASAVVEHAGSRYRIEVGSEQVERIGSESDSDGRAGSEGAKATSGG